MRKLYAAHGMYRAHNLRGLWGLWDVYRVCNVSMA